MLFQITVESTHHLTRDLVQTGAVNTQEDIRTRYLQVIKQRSFQGRILLCTSIYQLKIHIVRTLNGTDQRCYLDEVRAGTGHNTYVHHLVSLFATKIIQIGDKTKEKDKKETSYTLYSIFLLSLSANHAKQWI